MLFISIYFALGFIFSGMTYAGLQRKYPSISDNERTPDTIASLLVIVGWPGILVPLGIHGFYGYGWMLPGTKDN